MNRTAAELRPFTKRRLKKGILGAVECYGDVFKVVSTRDGVRIHMADCTVWHVGMTISQLKDDPWP